MSKAKTRRNRNPKKAQKAWDAMWEKALYPGHAYMDALGAATRNLWAEALEHAFLPKRPASRAVASHASLDPTDPEAYKQSVTSSPRSSSSSR